MPATLRDFPYTHCPANAQPNPLSVAPQGGTFTTADDPTWTYCHSESVVDIRVVSGVVPFVGLDAYIMICIQDYGTVPSSRAGKTVCDTMKDTYHYICVYTCRTYPTRRDHKIKYGRWLVTMHQRWLTVCNRCTKYPHRHKMYSVEENCVGEHLGTLYTLCSVFPSI